MQFRGSGGKKIKRKFPKTVHCAENANYVKKSRTLNFLNSAKNQTVLLEYSPRGGGQARPEADNILQSSLGRPTLSMPSESKVGEVRSRVRRGALRASEDRGSWISNASAAHDAETEPAGDAGTALGPGTLADHAPRSASLQPKKKVSLHFGCLVLTRILQIFDSPCISVMSCVSILFPAMHLVKNPGGLLGQG